MRSAIVFAAFAVLSACAPPSPPPAHRLAPVRASVTLLEEDAGIRDDLAPFLRPDPQPRVRESDRTLGSPTALTFAQQRANAVHEAGHAVVDAYYFGADFVLSMYVAEKVGDEDYYGVTEDRGFSAPQTAEQLRDNAVAYLAGRAADELINGAPDTGSSDDVRKANDAVRGLHRGYALGNSLLIDMRCAESAAEREVIERDMARLYGCASALIAANQEKVTALADLLMSAPSKKGRHSLGKKRLRAFLRANKPTRPEDLVVCDLTAK